MPVRRRRVAPRLLILAAIIDTNRAR
jgi:hypothetical protein